MKNNLYEFKNEIQNFHSIDKYFVVDQSGTSIFFENAFNPTSVHFEKAGLLMTGNPDQKSLFKTLAQPEILRAMVIPLTVIGVVYYQFYWKKDTKKVQVKLPANKEDRDKEF